MHNQKLISEKNNLDENYLVLPRIITPDECPNACYEMGPWCKCRNPQFADGQWSTSTYNRGCYAQPRVQPGPVTSGNRNRRGNNRGNRKNNMAWR